MTTNIPDGAPAEYMDETWRNKMGMAGAHEMFRNMVDSCFKKCTEYRIYHHEGTVGSGEGHCLDRCILKVCVLLMKSIVSSYHIYNIAY